jgi:hypothetical protein
VREGPGDDHTGTTTRGRRHGDDHTVTRSNTEAEEYLQRYLAASGARLRWLREHCAATGGPPPERLDFSRDSLVPLWAWAVRRFGLRPEGQESDPRRVPMWYGRRPGLEQRWWSDETLDLMDALRYYLAECLLRSVPGARWEVGHRPIKNWISENQPVLTGFTAPVDLELPMTTLVGRAFTDPTSPHFRGPPTEWDLQRQFDIEMEQATPEALGRRRQG